MKLPQLFNNKYLPMFVLVFGVVTYLLGAKILFLIATIYVLVKFMPMPDIFNTWASKVVMSVLILYALLQVSSVVQLFIAPHSNFIFTAIFTSILSIALIVLFKLPKVEKLRVMDFKDLCVIFGSILFIIPFAPVIVGDDSFTRITEIASIQVTDAIAHNRTIAGFSNLQSLDDTYVKGQYYPSGFHISSAFLQDSIIGNINSADWKTAAVVYFAQYVFFGFIFTAMILYFCMHLTQKLSLNKGRIVILAQVVAVSIAVTLMHTLLFFNDGFLNYYYISATLIAALIYISDSQIKFSARSKLELNIKRYLQPIIFFLLLAFGASMSWPLLAPVFILTVFMIFITKVLPFVITKDFLLVHFFIALGIGLHLLTVLFQLLYMNNGSLVNLPGALSNFNAILLLVGVFCVIYIAKTTTIYKEALMYISLPVITLIMGLMLFQFFTLGVVSYYTIKASLLFEILSVVLVVVSLLVTLTRMRLAQSAQLFALPILSLFLIFSTYASVDSPFKELRGLFRDYSGGGKPAHLDRDSFLVAQLGKENKIKRYNVTSLHYDKEGQRFYSHIQPVAWALSMRIDNKKNETFGGTGNREKDCFGRQFAILGHDQNSSSRNNIINAVNDCISQSQEDKVPYYIITDSESYAFIDSYFSGPNTIVLK